MTTSSRYPSESDSSTNHTTTAKLTLSRERNDDGKSFKNPQHGVLSKAYEEFPDPLTKGRRGGFDIHIYHFQVRNPPLPPPESSVQV